MIRKILKKLQVIQEVSNIERKKKGLNYLGKGFSEAYRLNPFNPLSYLTLIIAIVIGVLLFGFYGFWKEADTRNPFIWN